jgi:hypothetical protein
MSSLIRTVCLLLANFAWVAAASAQNCPFGTEQCKPGLVWREAYPGDKVCVTGSSRQRAVADNRDRNLRHVQGSDTCIQGFVWREASKGRNPAVEDHTCVTVPTRSETWAENDLAEKNIDPHCTARAQCESRCKAVYTRCIKPRMSPDERQACKDDRDGCISRC